jgi:uridine kinase
MTVIFIGLSRPSGTGKTTLAHLLHHTVPNVAHVLHADGFSKEFVDIPTVDEFLDCDGPVAVNFVRMAEVLDYMKAHNGTPPSTFSSWQESVFPGQEERAL